MLDQFKRFEDHPKLSDSPIKMKKKSDMIAEQTQRYLDNGGKITVIQSGYSLAKTTKHIVINHEKYDKNIAPTLIRNLKK